mmetsp:Transcript_121297/g.258915  ORF Transcript_121297/g.258915 Transcript_121297/m.258915 type:complete len:82 (+) Transcript_121297:111-356(+)
MGPLSSRARGESNFETSFRVCDKLAELVSFGLTMYSNFVLRNILKCAWKVGITKRNISASGNSAKEIDLLREGRPWGTRSK